jgi:hypothetical protein
MSTHPTSLARAFAPPPPLPWATQAFAPPSTTIQILILILLSLVGIFILLNLPSALARLSSGKSASLKSGYFFSKRSKKISPVRAYTSGLATKGGAGGKYVGDWMGYIPGGEFLGWEVFGGRYTLGQVLIILGYMGIVGAGIALSK